MAANDQQRSAIERRVAELEQTTRQLQSSTAVPTVQSTSSPFVATFGPAPGGFDDRLAAIEAAVASLTGRLQQQQATESQTKPAVTNESALRHADSQRGEPAGYADNWGISAPTV